MNRHVIDALRAAEAAAWDAIGAPTTDSAGEVHKLVAAALRAAEGATNGPICEAPTCAQPVQHKGVGRMPRYCSARCRTAAYRARRTG